MLTAAIYRHCQLVLPLHRWSAQTSATLFGFGFSVAWDRDLKTTGRTPLPATSPLLFTQRSCGLWGKSDLNSWAGQMLWQRGKDNTIIHG
ncbi:hypothetical protein GN956_G17241 [Arapaima gigas]